MRAQTKGIMAGAGIGLAVAGFLSLPSLLPSAIAQEEPVRTLLQSGSALLQQELDGTRFVKPPVRARVEPWVSTEVNSHRTVTKIGYGQTTFVDIYTTPTGVYSSDGLASPHIGYPGIHRNPEWKHWLATTSFAYLSDGNWVAVTRGGADSFIDLVAIADGRTGVREGKSACVRVENAIYC